MKEKKIPRGRLEPGVRNLDALVDGGLPLGTVAVVAGPPGAGKTILTLQMCFQNASPEKRVLYFNTLSEPTAKTLRQLRTFSGGELTRASLARALGGDPDGRR